MYNNQLISKFAKSEPPPTETPEMEAEEVMAPAPVKKHKTMHLKIEVEELMGQFPMKKTPTVASNPTLAHCFA